MWAITAQFKSVTEIWNKNGYSRYEGSKQIPAFYLDENIQGITSMEHAEKIALEILNPSGEFGPERFSITAVEMEPVNTDAVYCDNQECGKRITENNPVAAECGFSWGTMLFCKSCEEE